MRCDRISMRSVGIQACVALLCACSGMSPILLASSSKSDFDDAVYSGESTVLNRNPGVEEYRVFHQGAPSFVSVESVRQSAERRATEFCSKSGKRMMGFNERHSNPPHILGNFPRVELIFRCVDSTVQATGSASG